MSRYWDLTTGNVVSVDCQSYKVFVVDMSLVCPHAGPKFRIPELQLTVCGTGRGN